jgi:hypothetical protein
MKGHDDVPATTKTRWYCQACPAKGEHVHAVNDSSLSIGRAIGVAHAAATKTCKDSRHVRVVAGAVTLRLNRDRQPAAH